MTFGSKITSSTPQAPLSEPIVPAMGLSQLFEQSVLRPFVHVVGLTQPSCPMHPDSFEERLLDELAPPAGRWTSLNNLIDNGVVASQRIAFKELLTRDYQDGVRARLGEPTRGERHELISCSIESFARGTTPEDLRELIRLSDLARFALPVLNSFIKNWDEYLVRRIPPHVGHGERKTIHLAAPEVLQQAKDWEANQDRGSAATLLRHLKDFTESGTLESLQLLLRQFNNSGEWLTWLQTAPTEDASHPVAEQVIANTLIMLERLKELSSVYVGKFMKAGPPAFTERFPWYKPENENQPINPLAYPLFASALEVMTRSDCRE